MKLFFSIILFLFSICIHGQTILVKGKLYCYSDNVIPNRARVDIMNIHTHCDSTGRFHFYLEKKFLKDTIYISYFGSRQLHIINFPGNMDTLDLGNIPLFNGYRGTPVQGDTCNWYDFGCKHKSKLLRKEAENEIKKYVLNVNQNIEKYRFQLFDKVYKIKYNENYYYDNFVILDLLKPEN